MDKEDMVPIYKGILLGHKKEWNNAICLYMPFHLCMEPNLKWYKLNYLQNRNILTDIENKPMVTKGGK